ncbi:MAG: Fic family protein [Methanobrevibacter sp.]|nr:Fic family protein [Candidatus Methanovirga aequatorialis]
MNQLLKDLKDKKITLYDIPVKLAQIHNEFERIHPFLDGNGRTGRLVINLILVKLSIPPMIIIKKRRNQYLDALDLADKNNYGPLSQIIIRGILDNIYRFIIPHNSANETIVPLISLANKKITYEALKKAAIRGRIKATYENSK